MSAYGNDQIVKAVLHDWRTAPIDDRLKGMLEFLEKVTLRPKEVTREDGARLRASGVSNVAAKEALYVCFLFSTMDRLADAFGFPVSTPANQKWVIRILLRVGYWAAAVPG